MIRSGRDILIIGLSQNRLVSTMSIYFFSEGGKEDHKQKSIRKHKTKEYERQRKDHSHQSYRHSHQRYRRSQTQGITITGLSHSTDLSIRNILLGVINQTRTNKPSIMLLNHLKKLFSINNREEEKAFDNCRVFNCQRIDYISSIGHTPSYYSSEWVTYSFGIYFDSGRIIHFSQDLHSSEDPFNCPALIKTRELFINNLGFSYLKLDLGELESQEIIGKRKKMQINIIK